MAVTFSVTYDNYDLSTASLEDVEIRGLLNLGTYATNGNALTAAIVNAALLTAGHPAHETISTIKSVQCDAGSADGQVSFLWATPKMKAFTVGTQAALSSGTPCSALAVDSAALTLDGGFLSEALPATAVAVLGGRSAGGTSGVIKLVGDAPANTLEARYVPASRKVQLLAADNNTGLQVQYLTLTPNVQGTLTANGLPAEVGNGADLSNAAKSVFVSLICTK